MKRILLIIAAAVLFAAGASYISYTLGHWRGAKHGWSEAERIWVSRELRQKTEALRLIRSGQTQEGLQFLDHTLDVDILIAAGRSPLCCAPQLAPARGEVVHYLAPVAAYRVDYPRLPYDRNTNLIYSKDDVDRTLKEFAKE